MQNTNPFMILQQFQQFKQSLQGKDPKAMLQDLICSGKVTQAQVDQAMRLAEQFKGLIK